MINPSHPLYDAELQTRNAKRRLGNLKGSITRFRRKSATSLGRITEVDGRPVKVYQWPPPAPDLWGTILSDFANSLRSTLNYIAWELAVENMRKTGQSRKPSDQTQFPICDRPDNYQHRNTRRQIADILPEAIPEIERVQPYNKGNQPNNYLLSVLRELNNPMKHRFIIQLNSVARITGLPYVKTALILSL